ncbi:MAG: DUF2608 domain-containing protein [Gammaproteobacteria bacterium]|nr:DUF2608 domain-containing protein [Gammaproteobacteria bacterium]
MLSTRPIKNSIIHEISSIQAILNHVHPKSWLIVDLDNTLIEIVQTVGKDQWFSTLMRYACTLPLDKTEAIAAVITIYNAVQHHVSAQAVEATTVETIKELQKKNIPVLALTARGKEIIHPTLKQLKNVGIDFSEQWGEHQFPLPIHENNEQPFFWNGIICCSGRKKGDCLKIFFDAIDQTPEHITMVDDKLHHLTCVEKTIEIQGVGFTGLRYNFLDEKIKHVDMDQANRELTDMAHQFDQFTLQAIEKLKIPVPIQALIANSSLKRKHSTDDEEIPQSIVKLRSK